MKPEDDFVHHAVRKIREELLMNKAKLASEEDSINHRYLKKEDHGEAQYT